MDKIFKRFWKDQITKKDQAKPSMIYDLISRVEDEDLLRKLINEEVKKIEKGKKAWNVGIGDKVIVGGKEKTVKTVYENKSGKIKFDFTDGTSATIKEDEEIGKIGIEAAGLVPNTLLSRQNIEKDGRYQYGVNLIYDLASGSGRNEFEMIIWADSDLGAQEKAIKLFEQNNPGVKNVKIESIHKVNKSQIQKDRYSIEYSSPNYMLVNRDKNEEIFSSSSMKKVMEYAEKMGLDTSKEIMIKKRESFKEVWKKQFNTEKDIRQYGQGYTASQIVEASESSETEKGYQDRADFVCKLCGKTVSIDTSNYHDAMRHLEKYHPEEAKNAGIGEEYFTEKSSGTKKAMSESDIKNLILEIATKNKTKNPGDIFDQAYRRVAPLWEDSMNALDNMIWTTIYEVIDRKRFQIKSQIQKGSLSFMHGYDWAMDNIEEAKKVDINAPMFDGIVDKKDFMRGIEIALKELKRNEANKSQIQKYRYGDVKAGDKEYTYGKVVNVKRVKKLNYKHDIVDWIELTFENGVRDLRLPDDNSFELVKSQVQKGAPEYEKTLTRDMKNEIEDISSHSPKLCEYGHQAQAKRIAEQLEDILSFRSRIGNEFDFRHDVEDYLDGRCPFNKSRKNVNTLKSQIQKYTKKEEEQILDNPERAYNRGVGVSTIREILEDNGYSGDEIKKIIDSFYKSQIQKGQIFQEDELRSYWSSGNPIAYQGRKYLVGRMSYGDYFFEPYDEKHPEGRGESDYGGFHRPDVKILEGNKRDGYIVKSQVKKTRSSETIKRDIDRVQGELYQVDPYDKAKKIELRNELDELQGELNDALEEESKMKKEELNKAVSFLKSRKKSTFKNEWFQKILTDSQKDHLKEEVMERVDVDDYQWKAKMTSFLRSRGASDSEIVEMLDEISDEF